MMTTSTPEQLISRAEALGWPRVMHSNGAGQLINETTWRGLADLPPALRGPIALQLDRLEAEQRRQASFAAADAERDARRREGERPLDEHDPALLAARAREVELAARAEYRGSTNGRLETVADLLTEIRDLLKGSR